jgi:hypothetical protein
MIDKLGQGGRCLDGVPQVPQVFGLDIGGLAEQVDYCLGFASQRWIWRQRDHGSNHKSAALPQFIESTRRFARSAMRSSTYLVPDPPVFIARVARVLQQYRREIRTSASKIGPP